MFKKNWQLFHDLTGCMRNHPPPPKTPKKETHFSQDVQKNNFDIDCKKSVIKTLFKERCIEVLKRAKNRKIRLNSLLHMHTFYECSANVQCFLKMYVNSTALKWYYCDF